MPPGLFAGSNRNDFTNGERKLKTRCGGSNEGLYRVAHEAVANWTEIETCAFSANRPTRQEPSELSMIIRSQEAWEGLMNGLIYLIGLIVVIMAILSFFGLR
ncbi:MAG: hypothetical protein QOC84_3032 [Bradyrhizobium sp.]|nr:hypothetical protein [Bradyrhizobium sp.]